MLTEKYFAAQSTTITIKRPLDIKFDGESDRSYALGPSTPRQLAQEYFVAMYEDAVGFHLIGFL